MKLYSYYRSSAAYRVRIALNLKSVDCAIVPVNLLEKEHRGDAYLARNPAGLVPLLEVGDDKLIAQSVAILEYLEAAFPQPALLPTDPFEAASVRQLVNTITCDIHPLNNLRVLNWLRSEIDATDAVVNEWYCHWIETGFRTIETMLGKHDFCVGDTPGMADVCLVPQVYNARRFKIDLDEFPGIVRVAANCASIPAFAAAHPDEQPDAPD